MLAYISLGVIRDNFAPQGLVHKGDVSAGPRAVGSIILLAMLYLMKN